MGYILIFGQKIKSKRCNIETANKAINTILGEKDRFKVIVCTSHLKHNIGLLVKHFAVSFIYLQTLGYKKRN